MRIAFLSNKDPSLPRIDSDGGAVTPRQYAKQLGRMGHSVTIYTPKISTLGETEPYRLRKGKAQTESVVQLSENVTVRRVPLGTFSYSDITVAGSDMARILESFLFSSGLSVEGLDAHDIVHFFHPLAAFGAVETRAVDMSKAVLSPMLLGTYYLRYQELPEYYLNFEKLLIGKFQHLYAVSNDEKNQLVVAYGADAGLVQVTPRGIDTKMFRPKLRSGRKRKDRLVIVCPNAIRPQKAQDSLIQMAHALRRTATDFVVLLAGENRFFYKEDHHKYYENLCRLIDIYDLQNHVKFYGAMSQQKMADLIRSSDIAIVPSHAESFGKSVLECISCGTPTIVFDDVRAYDDYIVPSQNALMVRRDPEDLKNAVLELVQNVDLYARLSGSAIEIHEKFSWERVTHLLLDAYKVR
ncbi:MAG: glycosyltransferase family 4 protein [Candidatus Micrarchaeota archaeon]